MIDDLWEKVEKVIDFLPPMPPVATELAAVLSSDDVDLGTIARIISRDPSMAANILKIANSAAYGLASRVTGIDQAIGMLGTNEIASLCMCYGAARGLTPPPRTVTVDLDRFWRHSVATGVIARKVWEKLQTGRGEQLYIAGLVHDVGCLVLDRLSHEVYAAILDLTRKENISVLEAERCILGASHDVAGGLLLERWSLPDIFIECARCHHAPSEASEPYRVAVALVSLADMFARLTLHGFDNDMSGLIVSETDAFRLLEKTYPQLARFDVVKFVWDLEQANLEIDEMERLHRSLA
jgi:HD-like signal output (HDOD) protein